MQTALPLIRLSLLIPFVETLRDRGIDAAEAFRDQTLSVDSVYAPDTFLPAQVVYSLLEALAEAADDPYLGVTVGESLDLSSWHVFSDAAEVATSLGDFVNRFVIAAARSVRYTTRVMRFIFASDFWKTHRWFARSTCRARRRPTRCGLRSSISSGEPSARLGC